MKKWIMIVAVIALFCGCATPGKLIATASTTVDHAMQAWAVYVVDGKSNPLQEAQVRKAKLDYDAAEDAALEAFLAFSKAGDETAWEKAKLYLQKQQLNLVNLVTRFTGKAI